MKQPLLLVENLNVRYGNVVGVDGVSMYLTEGEIVSIVGANGAGKTTMLNALMGLVSIQDGFVNYCDRNIMKDSQKERISSGLVLVPEGRRILVNMTVEDNLKLGGDLRGDGAAVTAEIDALFERFPNLKRHRHSRASVLSGGEQQMLAIGRAMLAQPRLLMLDEPSLGLSPRLVSEVFALIGELSSKGVTILLVEQNVVQALKLSSRAYVLELGKCVMEGESDALLADPRMRSAYLGEDRNEADGLPIL